jgi:hypothetical protein
VRYALKDVSRDPAALREFLALGGRLPPLTLVGDTPVHGFDPVRVEALLAAPDAEPAAP